MESPRMNQFAEQHVEHWLKTNELHEARKCFDQGLQKLSFFEHESSFSARNLWIHTSVFEDWIGGGFAGLCKGVNVWFIPPAWNDSALASLRERFPPDFVLTEQGWDLIQGNIRSKDCCGENAELVGKLMIPTGGSSGKQKFAIHDEDTMLAAVSGAGLQFYGRSVQRGDFNYCNDLPLWHVSGWMQVIRSFLSDSNYFKGEFGRKMWSEISGEKWISVVPTQLQRMLTDKKSFLMLKKADWVIVGGGPCPVEVLTHCLKKGIHPWVTYGMTETLGMIAGKLINSADDLFVGATVFPHASVEIVDLKGDSIVTGNEGEIVVASSSLCSGYVSLNSVETTDRIIRLLKRIFTKDFGYLDAEDGFHVLGRMDDLIVTGGEKVNPFEVEEKIRELPGIEDCVVGPIEDSEWGERVVCLYTSIDGGDLDSKVMKSALLDQMEAFKIPKSWGRVESLKADEKGKRNRNDLKKRLGEVFAKHQNPQ